MPMKQLTETWKKIEKIASRDGRYKAQAYSFVMASVEYTISQLPEPRHVSAAELLDGIRCSALGQFGPMTKQVFNFWGIRSTKDFGSIVFNLVDEGLLSATEDDRPEDFDGVYDFKKVFEEDYYAGR
jgi:uncharacterized repeat protein (TIGR04138 family)